MDDLDGELEDFHRFLAGDAQVEKYREHADRIDIKRGKIIAAEARQLHRESEQALDTPT